MPGSDLQLTFGADASGVTEGVDQAKAAIDDFAPKIEALGKSFDELASHIKQGFDGVGGLARGLQSAGAAGAEGLTGLAAAGGGATSVVATVVAVATAAAAAMAEWAERTEHSSTATAEARQNAANLDDALGQANKTFGAAGDILANAFAPAVTQLVGGTAGLVQRFVDAANNGTALKTGLDGLIDGLKATFAPIMALGEAFALAWIVIKGAWDEMGANWALVQQIFATGCAAIKAEFAALGTTISAALAGDWSGAPQRAMQGVGAAAKAAAGSANDFSNALSAISDQDGAIAAGVEKSLQGFKQGVSGLFGGPEPSQRPGHGSAGGAPDNGAGQQQPAPSMATGGLAQGAASDSKSYVATLEAAFRQTEDSHTATLHNEQADELVYWQGVLTTANLTAAQRVAIQQKVVGLEAELSRQSLEQQVSDAHEAEQQQVEAINEGLEAKKRSLDEEIKATEETLKRGELGRAAATARVGQLIDQEVEAQKAAAQAIFDAKNALDVKIEALNDQDTDAYKAACDDQLRARKQLQDALTNADAAGALKRRQVDQAELDAFKQSWNAAINPMVSSFTKGLLQMAEGTKSFAQVLRSMGQQILEDFISRVIDPMVEKWLWKELRQTAATFLGLAQRTSAENVAASAGQGTALAQTLLTIKQDAAKVFGGIFAALSSNPATLPAAAPAAAAGAAAVMGFSYAEGGWADVPLNNMPTLLHAQEMVLPARLANPMRSMMDDYAAARGGPWNGPAQTGGGDTHVHHYNISAMDAGSFKTFLRGNKNPLSTVLQEMGRAGMKTA